ncbi:MAG: peptidylprolyl isomerase [Lysobacterales bacterium]
MSKPVSFAKLTCKLFAAPALCALLAIPLTSMADTALIETPLGDIQIELLTDDAPRTVANFLNYVQNYKYYKAFVHRSAPGFVIQGGGFTFNGINPVGIIPFDPVDNEFKISNTRGTVAMAKVGGQPDSATSQWFINLADNSDVLDTKDGGYTVFGRVTSGMTVADAISQLQIIDANGPFAELPVINYDPTKFITEANLVMTDISADADPQVSTFVMNPGLNDAWYNPVTTGQGFFITVFPDLGLVNLAWFTYDTQLPADESAANLGSPGHRWLTALGPINGNTAVLNINIARGGLFDTATEIQNTDPEGSDGTITLTFSDCSTGVVDYDIPSISQQGSVPIQRVANDNVALCETLSTQ